MRNPEGRYTTPFIQWKMVHRPSTSREKTITTVHRVPKVFLQETDEPEATNQHAEDKQGSRLPEAESVTFPSSLLSEPTHTTNKYKHTQTHTASQTALHNTLSSLATSSFTVQTSSFLSPEMSLLL